MWRLFWLVVVTSWVAHAASAIDKKALRKSKASELNAPTQRVVLPNGLTLVMSPDPASGIAVVDVAFAAGALFEPEGKSGLAHLVEHLLAFGPTPETDYRQLLERRGAADFDATTTADLMTFHVIVPPREVPLALWVASDRLLARPGAIDEAELARNRAIVVEERASRVTDAAYQTALSDLYRVMFPAPHPLHGMVLGVPNELAAVTVADARSFIARCLVPANAVVTITGTFDPAAAREWTEKTLGRLPGGAKLEVPRLPPAPGGRIVTVPEPRARRPRVTFAWEFGELGEDVTSALDFGATLVKIYTDGALGMRVDAGLSTFLGGNLFVFEVTLAHEAGKTEAKDAAEGLLRYLTRTAAADDVFGAALVQRDRSIMLELDDPLSRSARLSRQEFLLGDEAAAIRHSQKHWSLSPEDIGPFTRPLLETGRYTLQVRPLDPLPRRGF